MAAFPTMRAGAVSMYPVQRLREYRVKVERFANDNEQRYVQRGPLHSFSLFLREIDGYDLNVVRAFFRSCKGKFDATWTLTLDSVTYSNMAFAQDDLSWDESIPDRYTLSIKIIQTKG